MVGFSEDQFIKRGYDQMMEHHLNIGLADYCGVKDSKVHFMYNTLGEFEENAEEEKENYFTGLLDEAYQIGASFSVENRVES